MRKLKNPTVEGEVVGASGSPKKPIDKRWFIIGGLILVLVITFVVLLIVSNSGGTSEQKADPIDTEELSVVGWTCDDGSVITFDGKNNVTWADDVAIITNIYTVKNAIISFGNTTGTIKNDVLTLKFADEKITCQRSGQ